eukprot:jgi/Mesvir1/20072/Mv25405-RA.1
MRRRPWRLGQNGRPERGPLMWSPRALCQRWAKRSRPFMSPWSLVPGRKWFHRSLISWSPWSHVPGLPKPDRRCHVLSAEGPSRPTTSDRPSHLPAEGPCLHTVRTDCRGRSQRDGCHGAGRARGNHRDARGSGAIRAGSDTAYARPARAPGRSVSRHLSGLRGSFQGSGVFTRGVVDGGFHTDDSGKGSKAWWAGASYGEVVCGVRGTSVPGPSWHAPARSFGVSSGSLVRGRPWCLLGTTRNHLLPTARLHCPYRNPTIFVFPRRWGTLCGSVPRIGGTGDIRRMEWGTW